MLADSLPAIYLHVYSVAFSLEDVQKDKQAEILKVGAQVTFVYEPGSYELSADDVQLAS